MARHVSVCDSLTEMEYGDRPDNDEPVIRVIFDETASSPYNNDLRIQAGDEGERGYVPAGHQAKLGS